MKKVLRKFKSFLRQAYNGVIGYCAAICVHSRFLSSLFYLVCDRSFGREQHAVLAGRVKHLFEARKQKANYYLLIRNTHRIEKGLLMRPLRSVFAKDYIEETVDSFVGIWNGDNGKPNPQMKWFHDVLTEYFKVVDDSDPLIRTQKLKFDEAAGRSLLPTATDSETDCSVPYEQGQITKSTISFDEFFRLTRQRRSVRWFLDKAVPRELIDKAILAALQAPSACNRQPFEFFVFDKPEMAGQVAELPMGTAGYAENIPVMIVVVGNLDAYFSERDRHLIYIDASLASMSLMLALETLGLSSCPINWPDIEERERRMESFLKLERHQRPIMCIGVGYADPSGKIAFSEKRHLPLVRKYNLRDYDN